MARGEGFSAGAKSVIKANLDLINSYEKSFEFNKKFQDSCLKEIKALIKDVKNLTEKVEYLESQVSDLDDQVSCLETEISDLEEKLSD